MVRWLLCYVLLAGLAQTALAQPLLQLQTDKTKLELGESLTVKLYGVGLLQTLDEVDLKPLLQDFAIVSEYNTTVVEDSRWPDEEVQYLRFTLYPRSVGDFTIPSLSLGDVRSRTAHGTVVQIQVVQGSVQGKPIEITTHLSTAKPWQRQQILFTVTVRTPELFATLHAAELPRQTNRDSLTLPVVNNRITTQAGEINEIKTGWVIYPNQSGKQLLEIPTIQYQVSGLTARTYYLPPISLDVRSLPPYLPPTIPVGEVKIDTSMASAGVQQPDLLQYFSLTLTSETVLPHSFPALIRQIQSDSRLQVYPATIERNTQADFAGVHSTVRYQVPFKVLKNGRYSLPDLQFQYFDPASGRLKNVNYPLNAHWALSRPLRYSLLLIFTVLVLSISYFLAQRIKRYLRYQAQRKHALQLIHAAKDAQHLRSAMRVLATAEAWPNNLSLTEWQRQWRATYRTDKAEASLFNQLSNQLYGGRDEENQADKMIQLKHVMIHARHQTRKLPITRLFN